MEEGAFHAAMSEKAGAVAGRVHPMQSPLNTGPVTMSTSIGPSPMTASS